MELRQRKKKGDETGFAAGSKHWLKLNILKIEGGGSDNVDKVIC